MIRLDKITFKVFGRIHAEDTLKQKTTQYLYSEIRKRQVKSHNKKLGYLVAWASIFALLLCGGLTGKMYFTPTAYSDIDVNPSIALTVNPFGRVIRYGAYNDDGTSILNRTDISYIDYRKALELLLSAMEADGYFAQDYQLYVTVQAGENQRESSILSDLEQTIQRTCESHHYNLSAHVYAVTEEIKHCAADYQISPATYLAIQELMEIDSKTTFEECLGHSLHELHQQINEKCHEQDGNGKTHGHGGHGYHN